MKKKQKNATKIHFPPWNSANYKYFFRSKFFILWIKGKTDLETSSHPNRKSHKNCYVHFQKKKLSSLRIFDSIVDSMMKMTIFSNQKDSFRCFQYFCELRMWNKRYKFLKPFCFFRNSWNVGKSRTQNI